MSERRCCCTNSPSYPNNPANYPTVPLHHIAALPSVLTEFNGHSNDSPHYHATPVSCPTMHTLQIHHCTYNSCKFSGSVHSSLVSSCRMPCVAGTVYASTGFCAKVPMDAHLHCLKHALCTAAFRLYNPQTCPTCAITAATLLCRWYLTGLAPEHASIQSHWANLVTLCSMHGRTASWTDSDLPLQLGPGHPASISLSPLWQSLLMDPPQPEKPFSDFSSLTHTRQTTVTLPLPPHHLLLFSLLAPPCWHDGTRLGCPVLQGGNVYPDFLVHQQSWPPPSLSYNPLPLILSTHLTTTLCVMAARPPVICYPVIYHPAIHRVVLATHHLPIHHLNPMTHYLATHHPVTPPHQSLIRLKIRILLLIPRLVLILLS